MSTHKIISSADAQVIAGTPIGGGFAVGLIQFAGQQYLLIDSGRAGELTGKYGAYGKDVEGARSCFDGYSNTLALAESGSDLAQKILALSINGETDWYWPSRDELELMYRTFKPTDEENYCSFRDGDNATSVPVNYPYTATNPAQTAIEAYRAGGPEAFEPTLYWTSTQYSSHRAWGQHFGGGVQYRYDESYELRARAVRRLLIQ